MHFQGDEALVRIDHLFEVHGTGKYPGKGGIGIEVLVQGRHFLDREGAGGFADGEDAAGEIAPDRDEMEVVPDAKVPADFQQMLVGQNLIDGQVVTAPAEMGGGSRFNARPGGAGDGLDVDVAREETGLGQRQEGQLDGGRETAGVGHFPRLGDPVAVQLRKSIDIAVGLVPEILGQVDDLESFRTGMLLPESAALAMGRAQEQDVDALQVDPVRKHERRVAHKTGMMLRHGFAGLALRMDPGDLRLRVVHQDADQFAGGVSGASDDARPDHASSG